MKNFQALRVHETQDGPRGRLESLCLDDLAAGDVTIRAAYSDVNYKDALAVTGASPIMRNLPMVAGIDVSGIVTESQDDRFKQGDPVVVTGCGLGELHDGGYAEYVRVPADWVVPLPRGLSLKDAMALGTAGFTAAMAVHRLEHNGQTPDHGPIAVTGATGGVGSLVINMLKGRGYEVHAITGKPEQADYLHRMGADKLLFRQEIKLPARPLEKAIWGGAVDNLGGDMLGWLAATVQPWGNVASIGLANSPNLKTSVMPFILRAVSLLGINSVSMPRALRLKIWARLSTDLKPTVLNEVISQVVPLAHAIPVFQPLIDSQVTGRTLIELAGESIK